MKDFFVKYSYKVQIFDGIILKNSLFIISHIIIGLIILYNKSPSLRLDVFYFII